MASTTENDVQVKVAEETTAPGISAAPASNTPQPAESLTSAVAAVDAGTAAAPPQPGAATIAGATQAAGAGEAAVAAPTMKRALSEEPSVATVKRARRPDVDETNARVLFVRNLPENTTDQDLRAMVQYYGAGLGAEAEEILLISRKAQAFVQLKNHEQAQMVKDAIEALGDQTPRNSQGYRLAVSYSNHTEIKRDPARAPAAAAPCQVLMATITNVAFPVTLPIIHQLFQTAGAVQRIIIFQKRDIHALVEMDSVESATAARDALNGRPMYDNGFNFMRVEFSTRNSHLTVKYNTDRTRDYTNAALPAGPGDQFPAGAGAGAGAGGPGGYPGVYPGQPGPGGAPWAAAGGPAGMHAGMMPGGGYPGMPPMGMHGGMPGMPGGMPGMHGGMQGGMPNGLSPVVFIANFNRDHVTCDTLFTLCGVFGDVMRVKMLFNKTNAALVQFRSPQDAERALNLLQGCPLYGQPLTLKPSNKTSVSAPRTPEDQLTRDYTDSNLHRFKSPQSKNLRHICPPGDVLHLSNLPTAVAEADLHTLFGNHGTVVAFRFFHDSHQQALIKMDSINSAVAALVGCHNTNVGGRPLRVAFSKHQLN